MTQQHNTQAITNSGTAKQDNSTNHAERVLPIEKVEQFINNVKIINELAKPQPDINLLKTYQGFGGLRDCFWDKQLYGQIMRGIRANFGAEQAIVENMKQSVKSAYYTPEIVIKFIYRYLQNVCNFTDGDILEPACGHGGFFEHMPADMRANSKITGVDYDIVTSKIAQAIYPDVNIINNGLQNVDFNGAKFDLIIGNPPYSDEKVQDLAMPDLDGFTIHNYFIAKCVRLLKDDGLLVFVMPSFFMDTKAKNARHIIDGEAVFVDAVRLPENLFAHAKVTVDIIVIRKTGNKLHKADNIKLYHDNGGSEFINQYWLDNPQRVMGETKLKFVKCYNRFVPTCETQNKNQVFEYLTKCQFNSKTKENYQKIIEVLPVTKPEQQLDKLPQLVVNKQLIVQNASNNNLADLATQLQILEMQIATIQHETTRLQKNIAQIIKQLEESN